MQRSIKVLLVFITVFCMIFCSFPVFGFADPVSLTFSAEAFVGATMNAFGIEYNQSLLDDPDSCSSALGFYNEVSQNGLDLGYFRQDSDGNIVVDGFLDDSQLRFPVPALNYVRNYLTSTDSNTNPLISFSTNTIGELSQIHDQWLDLYQHYNFDFTSKLANGFYIYLTYFDTIIAGDLNRQYYLATSLNPLTFSLDDGVSPIRFVSNNSCSNVYCYYLNGDGQFVLTRNQNTPIYNYSSNPEVIHREVVNTYTSSNPLFSFPSIVGESLASDDPTDVIYPGWWSDPYQYDNTDLIPLSVPESAVDTLPQTQADAQSGVITPPDITVPDEDVITSDLIGSLFDSLGDSISSGFDMVVGGISTAVSSLTSTITDSLADVKNEVVSAINSVNNRFPYIPSIPSNPFGGIWHYVVEWLSYISGFISLVLSVWSVLPWGLVVPVYACVVLIIVFGVYRRFIS